MKSLRVAPIASALVGVVVIGLLVMLATASPNGGDSAQSPLIGRPAPSVVSTTLKEERFELSRRRGSWVVLNFFNSTCVPCRNEHPELVKFAKAQESRDVQAELYTIINDDADAAVESFFARNGGDWDKIRDPDGIIAVAFGVAKVPETWVIDPNGFVRLRIIGEVTADFLTSRIDSMQSEMPSGS